MCARETLPEMFLWTPSIVQPTIHHYSDLRQRHMLNKPNSQGNMSLFIRYDDRVTLPKLRVSKSEFRDRLLFSKSVSVLVDFLVVLVHGGGSWFDNQVAKTSPCVLAFGTGHCPHFAAKLDSTLFFLSQELVPVLKEFPMLCSKVFGDVEK